MKTSDIIERAYRHKAYRAWAPDVTHGKCGRLCFVIEYHMRCLSYNEVARAKVAVSRSILGNMFLSSFLKDTSEFTVYAPNPVMRKRAMKHWRTLVADLRARGE